MFGKHNMPRTNVSMFRGVAPGVAVGIAVGIVSAPMPAPAPIPVHAQPKPITARNNKKASQHDYMARILKSTKSAGGCKACGT